MKLSRADKSDIAFMAYLRPILKASGFTLVGVTSMVGHPKRGNLSVRADGASFDWTTSQWDALRPVFEAASRSPSDGGAKGGAND